MTDFILEGDFIQLIQLLKAVGLSNTGGHAKIMVEEGEVSVNGEVEFRKRRKLIVGDEVKVGQETVSITQN